MEEDSPLRLEDTDPELAELLRQVANKQHPTAKGLYLSSKGLRVTSHPIRAQVVPGRNDPCSCGSGKKYKKCCG